MAENLTVYERLFRREHAPRTKTIEEGEAVGRNATKAYSALRILFGSIFLFDGALKWILFQQGTMQATVASFGFGILTSNWVIVGLLVALGETFGGLAMISGLLQRPAALWSSAIMFSIWGLSGLDGTYVNGSWSFAGYTDPGGDLMLALVFLMLVFAPYAYGLASRWNLRARWSGTSLRERILRFVVT